jgi:hypothetical protein
MNDPARTSRSTELAALAKATDANGNVDLIAFEAQRLIYRHESIDGLDASALVRDLTGSAAYANQEGKKQMQPLLDAIAGRLPPDQALRFAEALDKSNVTDTLLERRLEVFSENMEKQWNSFKESVGQVDASISDALADGKRWAERMRDNPDNSYLERAAGSLTTGGAEKAQELYGQAKGASTHGVAMLGEVVDLAAFGARFTTDRDFRNLIIGAGLVYASETYRDPSKPIDDVRNVAVGAWNEWQKGLKEAQAQGKEQEYLGEAQGAVGIELLAAIVPATKFAKLGKIANAVDDVTPDAAGQTGRRAAGESTELLDELVASARKAQKGEKWESDSADLMFSGLAGVKRSQGELRELVDDMRAKGQLDGLLGSGALNLRELNYLARQDVSVFDGSVPFDKALEKWVGDRKLSELTDPMVGDMGEAIVAHKLARQGYRDLVPIQNNSGHGNDLAGINPETGRWEVLEVKASVQGIARKQGGNPDDIIVDRLDKAVQADGLWAPKNMWEEQAATTARRLLNETQDQITGKLDIDAKWARVNIERDANGRIHAEPDIEKWKTPEERKLDRKNKAETETPDESAPRKSETPAVERKPDQPQKSEISDDAAPRKAVALAEDANSAKAAMIGAGVVVVATPKDESPQAPSLIDAAPLVVDSTPVANSVTMAGTVLQEDALHVSKATHEDPRQSNTVPDRVDPMTAVPSSASIPARLSDPRDPDHPDHKLYKQIEIGVAKIDAEKGRTFDATSERMTMGAFLDAKTAGITSADHIAINDTGKRQSDGNQVPGGTLLFVVQGQDPSDPAAKRAITDVGQAIERPVEQSLQKLDTLNQQQAQALTQTPNNPTQDDPGPKGPRM